MFFVLSFEFGIHELAFRLALSKLSCNNLAHAVNFFLEKVIEERLIKMSTGFFLEREKENKKKNF